MKTEPQKLAGAVLAFAFLLEGLQYLRIVSLLGWQHNKLAVIIIGATFDPIDLLAYTIGIAVFYLTDKRLHQKDQIHTTSY
jgi:hypothetical protein